MSGQATRHSPTGAEAGAAADAATGREVEEQPNPVEAFAAAIEREEDSLRQKVVHMLVGQYRKWGRHLPRAEVVPRAEELLHAALDRAFQRAADFDPTQQARPWVLRFAFNILREQERADLKERRQRAEIPPDSRVEGQEEALALMDRLADLTQENQQRLREYEDLVSPQDWALIKAAHVDRATRAEMAAALGISAERLRVRLFRAVGRFKAAYKRAQEPGA